MDIILIDDTLRYIVNYLSLRSLLDMRSTCKKFHTLITLDILYDRLIQEKLEEHICRTNCREPLYIPPNMKCDLMQMCREQCDILKSRYVKGSCGYILSYNDINNLKFTPEEYGFILLGSWMPVCERVTYTTSYSIDNDINIKLRVTKYVLYVNCNTLSDTYGDILFAKFQPAFPVRLEALDGVPCMYKDTIDFMRSDTIKLSV